MLFECKVYDKNGKLKKTHTSKQLQKRSDKICMAMLLPCERRVVENYTETGLRPGTYKPRKKK